MTNSAQSADRRSTELVWDCHVHCYPKEVCEDPVAFAERHREMHWLDLVTNGPQGWADPEILLRAMDRDGIDKVVLQAWYWENPATCQLQNEWHAEWIQRYPERLLGCAAIHPDDADPIKQLKDACSWGAVGVGELLPAIQSPYGWGHAAWESIIEETTKAGLPLNVHVTEPVGHDYPGRVETSLMEMVDLFENHPHQKWICAHWGGGLPFHAMNRRVKKAIRNVWFDSAASPLLYSAKIWQMACQLVGVEKILFGSDFPLLLYPSSQQKPGWSEMISELLSSGLSPDAIEAICYGNLKELLKIPVA